jgi:hypothetical protein
MRTRFIVGSAPVTWWTRLLVSLLLAMPLGAFACSKHGTGSGSEIKWKYGGQTDRGGDLLFVVGIEDEIVEPAEATTCVTAIGLGSTERMLPQSIRAVSARVDRVNRVTGKETRIDNFQFEVNANTSRGMAAGGGSTSTDPGPVIEGAEWFGFSSSVEPFTLETGPDEFIRMTFEVLVPETLVPFLADVQFASGEGQADGTPIFNGEHPVQYYTADNPLAELWKFQINSGLNDAWYNPDTAGQGFLVAVFPEITTLFLAWFTYDLERPLDDVTAMLGEPGHRWLTAQGPYGDDSATLDVYLTSGGVFDSAEPAAGPAEKVGTMTVSWTDCYSGAVDYQLPALGLTGTIPIERIVLDNVSLCQALNVPPLEE